MLQHSTCFTHLQRYFHGVNYVRKGHPYVPDVLRCDAIGGHCPASEEWVLTDADALDLAQKGMNVVRLGVMWPGAVRTRTAVRWQPASF